MLNGLSNVIKIPRCYTRRLETYFGVASLLLLLESRDLSLLITILNGIFSFVIVFTYNKYYNIL